MLEVILLTLVVDLAAVIEQLLPELKLHLQFLVAELLQRRQVIPYHEELDRMIDCVPPPGARFRLLAARHRSVRLRILLEEKAALPLDRIIHLLDERPGAILFNVDRK